ncbi:hypothetical protein fh0823_09380 [Francisella halioticida]|nr:hypothetical protein fh0823_09380 [Francisella halioticida]
MMILITPFDCIAHEYEYFRLHQLNRHGYIIKDKDGVNIPIIKFCQKDRLTVAIM